MFKNNITQLEFQLRDSGQRRFLDLFEPNRRSYVTNLFCYAVRSGYTAPTSIIASVKNNAEGGYTDIPQIIDEYRQAAEDFANYILHWESLTFGEKRAIKEEKAQFTGKCT